MEEIKCPKCQKVIGRYVTVGGINSPVGYIPTQEPEFNGKQANVWWNGKRGEPSGTLCKECADKMFPEGKAFYVKIVDGTYKGVTIGKGDDGHGTHCTKASAQKLCREMIKKTGRRYIVSERKI